MRYRPLTDGEHFDRVRATRAQLETQLKLDFPAVSRVEWQDGIVRALARSGSVLASGPSLATIRVILGRGHG